MHSSMSLLYDISADKREARDLSSKKKFTLAKLREKMKKANQSFSNLWLTNPDGCEYTENLTPWNAPSMILFCNETGRLKRRNKPAKKQPTKKPTRKRPAKKPTKMNKKKKQCQMKMSRCTANSQCCSMCCGQDKRCRPLDGTPASRISKGRKPKKPPTKNPIKNRPTKKRPTKKRPTKKRPTKPPTRKNIKKSRCRKKTLHCSANSQCCSMCCGKNKQCQPKQRDGPMPSANQLACQKRMNLFMYSTHCSAGPRSIGTAIIICNKFVVCEKKLSRSLGF